MFTLSHLKALVLENLIAQNLVQEILSDKKIGVYPGSFDPFHLGHEQLVIQSITQGFCDYVLICPNWGGDIYKDRVDIQLRLDMVFGAFKDHPNVIVTRLPPQEIQAVLTKEKAIQTVDGKTFVEPKFERTIFMGIVGSDTALDTAKPEAEKKRSIFMTGMKIPVKYYNHTIGGLMALPATSFIISVREGDDIKVLNDQIGDRAVIARLHCEDQQGLSSTKIKQALKNNESIDAMVSPSVLEIIQRNGLYLS